MAVHGLPSPDGRFLWDARDGHWEPRGSWSAIKPEATLDREEAMRTALILGRTADLLEEALAGRARFEVREEAWDTLGQARRHLAKLDGLLWGVSNSVSSEPAAPDGEHE